MNEEVVVTNANGAFISPQMASFTATQWNEKNPKNAVAYVACSEKQFRKIETLYADSGRKDVIFNRTQHVLAGIPVKVDKFIPRGEIHMRAADHRVVAKIVGLDE